MAKHKIRTAGSFFMIALIGASLAIFTLHSHYTIQWHHADHRNQTENTITVDSAVYPICAYIFKPSFVTVFSSEIGFHVMELIEAPTEINLFDAYIAPSHGRSPPSIG